MRCEYLIALAYLFLRSDGSFGLERCTVIAIGFGKTSNRTPLAPFYIARESFEKRHVDFGWFFGKNLQSYPRCPVNTAAGFFNQTCSLQENICPSSAVSESGLPSARQ